MILLRHQPHLLCPGHQLQRALYYRSIDHLGAQTNYAQSMGLGVFVGGDDP